MFQKIYTSWLKAKSYGNKSGNMKKSIKTLISEMDADEWEKFRIN